MTIYICKYNISRTFLISVLIPIYNKEKYLHRSMISLRNQTFSQFEIIAADDC